MASKKGGKKKSPASLSPLAAAAAAGNVNAALMAVSTSAEATDSKRDVIYGCIVSVFHAQGFPHINSPQALIVWEPIPNNVIVLLGNGITTCINGKGFLCAPLAPAFQNLKNMKQVTQVSDLVTGIAAVVTP